MSAVFGSRLTVIWLLLVGATLLSWELGHGIGISDVRHAALAIIVVAFVKVRFVLLDFMELGHAPQPAKIAAQVWLVVACTAVVTVYLVAG